ncbi:MAG TPA: DUF4384 domain-containing protein [Gemmatimonadales bacterium]|nr:DUF4384 domain-containing protein [Gemmatimonadales bacterium]
MMLALMLSLLGTAPASAGAPAVAATSDDPPIKVWLNHDDFQRGDKARVNVKTGEDGYVVVLRADADGRVRVLFPLDPSDDDFVRGGETIEVRGRGDREAFYVDDRDGSGLVVAARSVTPFKFDEFVRGDHWDYRVLDARQAGDDKEAALVDIVQRMTDGHFDYDAASYVVVAPRAYRDYYPASYGWGWPYSYGAYYGGFGSCYDPFYYDPFYCGGFRQFYYDPFFYDPFFFGVGFTYRPFIYRPFIYGSGSVFYNQPRGLFVNRLRSGPGSGMYFKNRTGTGVTYTGLGGIGARSRIGQTTMFSGNGARAIPVRDRGTAFPVADRPSRSSQGDRSDRMTRSRGDDRESAAPSRAREPERREPSRGSDRPSGGGGRDRGVSAPSRGGGGGGSPSRGGGGGGGGGGDSRGGGGGGGGGGRRHP